MWSVVAAFVASSFALVRFALKEHRAMADRFTGFLEGALARQQEVNAKFTATLEQLVDNVRENSLLLNRVVERLGMSG